MAEQVLAEQEAIKQGFLGSLFGCRISLGLIKGLIKLVRA